LATPWFHLSLDDFRSGFSSRWWIEDDGQLFERVMVGYLGSLVQIANAGSDVLAESVITPTRQPLYESIFGAIPIALIGVQCPLEVAIERERARGDRRRGPIDLDAEEYMAVHAGLSYDLEVSTAAASPTDLAVAVAPQFDRLIPSPLSSHLMSEREWRPAD
jgi:chloramphenicol 3-O phosphotransferase